MSISSRTLVPAAIGAMLLASLGMSAATGRTNQLREIRCDMLGMDHGAVRTIEALDLHVLRDTAREGAFAPTIPQGIVGIMCARTSIVPAAYDDEVVLLGMAFHIAQMGSSHRLAVIELNEGRYRYRMLQGPAPDAEEQAAIDARLAEFQARFPTPATQR